MDDRSKQALDAAVTVAAEHGVRALTPRVLADGSTLVVHLDPAPVVARVPTGLTRVRRDIDAWLEREIDVCRHLDRAGIPVQVPSQELPAGPHERDGHWISYWTLLETEVSHDVTAGECAAMLRDLHVAMSVYPGELPVLGPAISDIPLGMAGLIGLRHLLDDNEIAAVRDRAADLVSFAEDPAGPWVGLHGDLHPGNLVRTARGPVWIDLINACRGPAEWDLALLDWLDLWSGTTSVRDHFDPDPESLRQCSDLRAVYVIASLVLLPGAFGGVAEYTAHLRAMVDLLLGR